VNAGVPSTQHGTAVRDIAILGLGNVAESHLEAYQTLSQVKVVAVVEPREDRRVSIGALYNVPGFASTEAMLRECRPHIACILTPTQTHRHLTELCADSGVHILCEKPIAVALEDALAIDRACVAAKVQFFYGSSYRYLPAVQAAKAAIVRGDIGAVRLITEEALTGKGADDYRALSPAHYPAGGPGGGGYGLVDHGIHMLDIFPWLCDSRIVTVMGRGDRTGALPQTEFAVLTLQCGAVGMLAYDGSTRPAELATEGVFSEGREWIEGRGWVGEKGKWQNGAPSIRVYGTRGSLRIFHYANKLFMNQSGEMREERLSSWTTPYHFARQMEAFCASLDRGGPPPTSAHDGIQALRALHAVYDSEARGQWQMVG
jgi:UDP-N-acetyl-2-amino-2-deoxyglucuronate dehydrogenase